MNLQDLQQGDAVYAAATIANDGSVPDVEIDTIFAQPGTMGMLLNTGYLEEYPEQELYLVSFENARGELGPPVTCLPEELSLTRISRSAE